jgi:tellurite resistance protein
MSSKKPRVNHLEKHAEEIRKELQVSKQNDVFRVAVEAGYLAALADGTVDADERDAIVKAIHTLSVGAVIEWEVEALIDTCAERAGKEGASALAKACGEELKALGQPEAGLLFAAVVAQAAGGIDEQEKRVLEEIADAAGLKKAAVGTILKRAGSI